MTTVARAEHFDRDVRENVTSLRVLNSIERALKSLETIPEMGSSDLPRSIEERFGATVRKLACPPFLVIYEYFPDEDLAVAYGLAASRQAF